MTAPDRPLNESLRSLQISLKNLAVGLLRKALKVDIHGIDIRDYLFQDL